MPRNRIQLIFVLMAAALLPTTLLAAPKSIDKVNGAIRTEAGTEYGSLETVNGSIRVASGSIARSAETVNGSIELEDKASVGSAEAVNGAITARREVIVERDLETVNGTISLGEGTGVGGKVETVNGAIKLNSAAVNGGIETVNGDIEILKGSQVRGGIKITKPGMSWWGSSNKRVPKVTIGANSVVEGDLVFEREVELYVDPTAKIGRVVGEDVKRMDVE